MKKKHARTHRNEDKKKNRRDKRKKEETGGQQRRKGGRLKVKGKRGEEAREPSSISPTW